MIHFEELSYSEAAVLFVLHGLKQKNGRKFTQGKFNPSLQVYEYYESLSKKVPPPAFTQQWTNLFPEWKDLSVEEVLSTIRIKDLRQNAQTALLAFWLNSWPLIGRWDYPSPNELLKIQAQGFRVVSILKHLDFNVSITDDKNNLEFTIHDLEHAAKYFEDPVQMRRQKRQFEFLELLAEESLIRDFCQNDPIYNEDWNYLISDMNTDPAHSWFFFRGTLLNAFKRREQIPATERLTANAESEFVHFEKYCLDKYFTHE